MAIINAADGRVLLQAARCLTRGLVHAANAPAMGRALDAAARPVGRAAGTPTPATGPVTRVVTTFRWPGDPRPIFVGWWIPRFLQTWLHAG